MESISVQNAQALLRSLERLYRVESLKQFPSTVFGALGELIQGAIFSLDTFDLKTGEVISVTSDNVVISPEIKNRIVELVRTSPALPIVRAGAKGAIRLIDCAAQRRSEQPPLYLDVFVPMGVCHQRVVTLDLPGHVARVTVNRDKDFTDDEALLLRLAAPHVTLAHQNLQRLESFKMAAAQIVPGPRDLERVGLTPREAEVLHWVMKGKQDGVIAEILGISSRTVHQHIASVLRKLGSESRGSASYEAMVKLKGLERPAQAA